MKKKVNKKNLVIGTLLIIGGFGLILGGLAIGDFLLSIPTGGSAVAAGLVIV